mmetsp:Transcript_16589/g.23449  ORF Transcript_16589/g.23449 Transcript_16589/m.23449 type:complete len:210 (+) Transcript_16589:124-753(+)
MYRRRFFQMNLGRTSMTNSMAQADYSYCSFRLSLCNTAEWLLGACMLLRYVAWLPEPSQRLEHVMQDLLLPGRNLLFSQITHRHLRPMSHVMTAMLELAGTVLAKMFWIVFDGSRTQRPRRHLVPGGRLVHRLLVFIMQRARDAAGPKEDPACVDSWRERSANSTASVVPRHDLRWVDGDTGGPTPQKRGSLAFWPFKLHVQARRAMTE